jgi:ketosteroid isomerase-like protein
MTDESRRQILGAREAINDAIARRDSAGIAAFLLPDYVVVTARSMQRDGRDASARSWADLFVHDEKAAYSRTPEEVLVNEGWGMAQEHGRWTGTVTTREGVMNLGGVYAAKWQYTDDGWKLRAEIFTPLSFDGPTGG